MEEEEYFVSAEARSLWNRQLAEKGFIGERGFWKPISPFAELIEKKGLGVLLRAKNTRFCCFGKRILHEYGRDEG